MFFWTRRLQFWQHRICRKCRKFPIIFKKIMDKCKSMNFFCFLVSVSVAPLVHQEGKITKTSKMFLLEHLHGKKVEYEICCMMKLFLLCTQMVELFQFKFLVDSLKLQDFSKETSFFFLCSRIKTSRKGQNAANTYRSRPLHSWYSKSKWFFFH